jgi:hypothetical protein
MKLHKTGLIIFYSVIIILYTSSITYFIDNHIDEPPRFNCAKKYNNIALAILIILSIAMFCLVIEIVYICGASYCDDIGFALLALAVAGFFTWFIGSMFIVDSLRPISHNKDNFEEVYANISGKWNETIRVNDYCAKVYYYSNNNAFVGVQYVLLLLTYIFGIGIITLMNSEIPTQIKCLNMFWLFIQLSIVVFAVISIIKTVIEADYRFQACRMNLGFYYMSSLSIIFVNVIWFLFLALDYNHFTNNKTYKYILPIYVFNVIKSIISWLVFIGKGLKFDACFDSTIYSSAFWYFAFDNTWVFSISLLFLLIILMYNIYLFIEKVIKCIFVNRQARPEEIEL